MIEAQEATKVIYIYTPPFTVFWVPRPMRFRISPEGRRRTFIELATDGDEVEKFKLFPEIRKMYERAA